MCVWGLTDSAELLWWCSEEGSGPPCPLRALITLLMAPPSYFASQHLNVRRNTGNSIENRIRMTDGYRPLYLSSIRAKEPRQEADNNLKVATELRLRCPKLNLGLNFDLTYKPLDQIYYKSYHYFLHKWHNFWLEARIDLKSTRQQLYLIPLLYF